MTIETITIKQFRSIETMSFSLRHCTLLVGANNAGKTNVADAIRWLFGDLQVSEERDCPAWNQSKDAWEGFVEARVLMPRSAVLFDSDANGSQQLNRFRKWQVFLESHRNSQTLGVAAFGPEDNPDGLRSIVDLESFLGLPTPKSQKEILILVEYEARKNNAVFRRRIKALVSKIDALFKTANEENE